jgi:hypothetical protein
VVVEVRRHAVAMLAVACSSHHGAHVDSGIDSGSNVTGATIHGAITSIETVNDGSGNPIGSVGAPDTSAITLTVTRVDGTSDAVALGSDGTFTFDVAAAGDPYRLTMLIQGAAPDDYESSAANLAIRLIGAGHIPRSPVTELQINSAFGNWVAGDIAVLQTTGLWTQEEMETEITPPGSATEPWQFLWSWQDADSLSGSLGLIDATQNDRLFITEWHTVTTPARYESITAALGSDDLVMANGQDLTYGIPATPLTIPAIAQRCAKVIAPRRTELARLTAALPGDYAGSTDAWTLEIAAGSGIGALAAQAVAGDNETSGIDGSGSDANLLASFGDPFGGSALLLELEADQLVGIQATADDQPVYLDTGTDSIVALTVPGVGSCGASAPVADATPTVGIAAIPVATGIAPVTLGSAGAVIDVAAGSDVTVSWTLAAPGAADEYAVQLFSVADDADQATLSLVRTVFTTETSTSFDTVATLQSGTLYFVRVFARQGFPGAGSGDFATIAFPFANAVTTSQTFMLGSGSGSGG